ncbi:hypothetical protein TraAM80_03456 [Trypanosoma rangeli]|uniref:Uncharacterized protein n=1 Tax=Trypanosoma rangeli TaxID=5698 RepID=A0A3R7NJB9_TRYRA|nr:uncharacterized protein TraAM80_03456 [Trypanosoma rangeli]RNF07320.1 hypothetical protein TraAM80_03456 [Trypanosoma rangeli]|eukprot:RNF07320.1 hypothetical protein TraAM80_03456 [Trypanosoma rangeli]
MRYLSVSSPGSFSVGVGASGELHGFTVQLLENSRGRLRARSLTLGKAAVAILRVGALDDMLQCMGESKRGENASADASPFSPCQHASIYRYPLQDAEEDNAHAEALNTLVVVVGSDDGYSAATLLRVAALVGELCLFLNIDPRRGGPNAPVLKQTLLYLESRLGLHDVSLLCQTTERLVRPAIIATGFASPDAGGLLDDLARQSLLQDAAGCQPPSYIAVLLGHKLVLETTPRWSEEAARAGGVERVSLLDSDRYLAYIVTCAFFSAPMQYSCYDVSPRERRLRELERRLRRFGIHRHNVSRQAARRVIQTYTEALRQGTVGEYSRASFFEAAYDELLALMTGRNAARGTDEAAAEGRPRVARNEYHHVDMDFDAIEGRTFQLDNICLRNSDVVGAMQLQWISAGAALPQDSSDAAGEGPLLETCPCGYGVCLLYLPPQRVREEGQRQPHSPTMANRRALSQLTRDILGSVETSFNCVQWLLSPPVESYEIPGLIHFVAVDRRTNKGVVASFHRMMHEQPAHVQNAVETLRRLVALNVSRSHALMQAGYSEGLWGHLGMQFFYCVCNLHRAATKEVPPPSHAPPTPHTRRRKKSFFFFGGESAPPAPPAAAATAMSSSSSPQPAPLEGYGTSTRGTESILGSLNPRGSLPAAVLPHLVLRPMLLPDFTCDAPTGDRVVEVYAVFVGTMSPAEVCEGVEKLLRSRVLPSWNTH